MKICPNCGAECVDEAVLCIKCGEEFKKEKSKRQPKETSVKAILIIHLVALVVGLIILAVFHRSAFISVERIATAFMLIVSVGVVAFGTFKGLIDNLKGLLLTMLALFNVILQVVNSFCESEISIVLLIGVVLYPVIPLLYIQNNLLKRKSLKILVRIIDVIFALFNLGYLVVNWFMDAYTDSWFVDYAYGSYLYHHTLWDRLAPALIFHVLSAITLVLLVFMDKKEKKVDVECQVKSIEETTAE